MRDKCRNHTVIILPVFDDWECAEIVVGRIDTALTSTQLNPWVILVDDGSSQQVPAAAFIGPYRSIQSLEVIHLRRNLGHQRAIAVGLAHVYQHFPGATAAVMDADGEDRPEDLPTLFQAFAASGQRLIIFASRARRLERGTFQVLYHVYRLVHLLLTGIPVKVGNFSVAPHSALARLMCMSELWNHYAAAVFRSRLPYRAIPVVRGRRIHGQPKMDFISLVMHGFGAISVFGDIVAVRLMVLSSLVFLLGLFLFAAILLVRFQTNLSIPGWATSTSGLLAILVLQVLTPSTFLAFILLGNRSAPSFLPERDCPYFVSSIESRYNANERTEIPG